MNTTLTSPTSSSVGVCSAAMPPPYATTGSTITAANPQVRTPNRPAT
jgi:hypothetical protein